LKTRTKASRILTLGLGLSKATLKFTKEKVEQKLTSSRAYEALAPHIKATQEIVETMAEMRGAMQKIGQMLGLSEDILLPKEIALIFQKLNNSEKLLLSVLDYVNK